MKIFLDILTGVEIGADSYPVSETADGTVLVVEGSRIKVGGEKFDTGANASAEAENAEEESVSDEVKEVINVVEGSKLAKYDTNKDQFKEDVKQYFKLLEAKFEGNDFKLKSLKEAKPKLSVWIRDFVLPNFDKITFYTGQGCYPADGCMLIACSEDGDKYKFHYFKIGIKEEKV
jgi:hypothetical protein